ncbi:Hypothetical Protein FCC1311_031022 [Hondaea fermentalgiana]|uniref:Uncharacterized protein n=1 Tax=Hondaea fermentalgiana TaxID=2315210 RepID=A0A2R5G7A8_9STRA|nr:Hypothetical Protein FCC1311_031022 [Hondaea fermentalgiana]|eukprot:GBG26880.1 Hypothetical Protein FCC1311_031022 [Hondaea fermentalgiana]
MANLVALVSGDAPAAWQRAGFALSRAPVPSFLAKYGCSAWLNLPTQNRRLAVGLGAESTEHIKSGISAWVWAGLKDKSPQAVGDFASLAISDAEAEAAFESDVNAGSRDDEHPNGIVNIDQVVLRTLDMDSSLESFEAAGLKLLRKRDDLYPGTTQAFIRPCDDVILEIVSVSPELRKKQAKMTNQMVAFNETENSIWGLTYVVKDIEAAAEMFSPNISKVNNAKQPGRKIATLRTEQLGLRAAIAIMSAHVKLPPGQDAAVPSSPPSAKL